MRPVAAIFSACNRACSIRLRVEISRKILDAPIVPTVLVFYRRNGEGNIEQLTALGATHGLRNARFRRPARIFSKMIFSSV